MARHKLLLGLATAVLVAASLGQASPAARAETASCLPGAAVLGSCAAPRVDVEATTDPDGVTLKGSVDLPGSANRNGRGNSDSGAPAAPPPPLQPGDPAYRDGYTVTAPVTLSDLVNFRPTPGTGHMEPNGWMVVGLDTNFYARATVQVQTGDLLGQPATVRFTPVRYRWSYGDGAGATRANPGTSWKALGVTEFDPTPTSHVYRDGGSYNIDLTIDFAAEYRYTSTYWIPIAGVIPVPANRLVAVAGDARTVLVERECTLSPFGPGC